MDMVRSHTQHIHLRNVDTRVYVDRWKSWFQFPAFTNIVPSTAGWAIACATIQADFFDYSFMESFLGYILRYDECSVFSLSLHVMVFTLTCYAIAG